MRLSSRFLILLATFPCFFGHISKPVIFLVSYFRTGSSFTGELLKFPGSWYYFEPFHVLGMETRIRNETDEQGRAMDVLEGLLTCDFNYLFHEVQWFDLKFSLRAGEGAWRDILGKDWMGGNFPRSLYFKYADELESRCKNVSGFVVKTTRMRMDMFTDVFQELKNKDNVHVVLNVRDPRGVINSRRKLKWCQKNPKCLSSANLCQDYEDDFKIFQKLKSMYPNNFHFQRFEDLIADPRSTAFKLYHDFGLNYTLDVSEYIQSHSKAAKKIQDNPYNTHREPGTVVDKWVRELDIGQIREIESNCGRVFKMFDYEIL